jgi:hypothetical protein
VMMAFDLVTPPEIHMFTEGPVSAVAQCAEEWLAPAFPPRRYPIVLVGHGNTVGNATPATPRPSTRTSCT